MKKAKIIAVAICNALNSPRSSKKNQRTTRERATVSSAVELDTGMRLAWTLSCLSGS